MGHPVEEVTFTRDALYIADEVFFTGTAAEVTPVREVDNRQVGDGHARDRSRRRSRRRTSAWCAGRSRSYAEWLTLRLSRAVAVRANA